MRTYCIIAGALVAVSISSPAFANRTFVSGNGIDSGSCPTTSPCRSFAYALTQTTAGGEVVALDTAGYGAATITQAVSIFSPEGITAFVTPAAGADGITINAGSSDSVVLRGITVDGQNVGRHGIVFNSGGSLRIEKCNVMNSSHNGNGILLQPSLSLNAKITILETNASNNGNAGITLQGTSSAKLEIDHVVANSNYYGIILYGSPDARFSISNAIASNNGGAGFLMAGATGMALDSVTATNNNTGITFYSGTSYMGRSLISGNSYAGVYGSAFSYGDNRINGNATDIAGGTLTPAGLQ